MQPVTVGLASVLYMPAPSPRSGQAEIPETSIGNARPTGGDQTGNSPPILNIGWMYGIFRDTEILTTFDIRNQE